MAKNGEDSQKVGPNMQFLKIETEKYKNVLKIAQNGPALVKNGDMFNRLVPMCSSLRWKLKNAKIAEKNSKWSKMAKNGEMVKRLNPNIQFLKIDN